MFTAETQLRSVLSQTHTSVAIRRGKGFKLEVKLPFAEHNRTWLQQGIKSKPVWRGEKKHWELPANHFNKFVERALSRYKRLYVIQPYREHETCAPACWNAVGHECQCSCMGAHHGSGAAGNWFVVSDTFAVQWHNAVMACRLMTAKDVAGE